MSEQENTLQYETARHAMVVSQLRPNRVTDEAVVEALDSIPREIFVPAALRGVAYMDEDIPLGNGRYLMEPLTFARLLQEAQISAADTVLDIGCATGYSSAVLGRLAGSVIGLEEDKELAEKATATWPVSAAITLPLSKAGSKPVCPGRRPSMSSCSKGRWRRCPGPCSISWPMAAGCWP